MKIGYCLILGVAGLLQCCSPAVTFSAGEKKVITSGHGEIMRLLTVDVPEDSLFLRQKALSFDRGVVSDSLFGVLKRRMLATVCDTADPGVGIAAPQVGLNRKLIAVQRFDQEGAPFCFYINPRIVWYSAEKSDGEEGCLSIPGRSARVPRSSSIVLAYTDEQWVERQDTVTGFTAVIFQHETDHLDGILYTDRVAETIKEK